MKKKLIIALAVLLAVLVAVLGAAGCYLVNFGIVRADVPPSVAPESVSSDEAKAAIARNYPALAEMAEAWIAASNVEKVHVLSDDGLRLTGEMVRSDPADHRWLLAVHGYISKKEDYRNVAAVFAAEGYNVLMPDLRAHGESEGRYIGMGWLDRMDILKWIDFIVQQDPQAQIILHGTSMGAATVMMASGETLPENVKGIVEDCGYTSVWDIFTDELDLLFGLPPFPVLHAASIVCGLRAGYTFGEASALEKIGAATLPMLFIHGSADNFVRTDMVYELYEAYPAEKELLVVEGAGHGESYCVDPQRYFGANFDFIEKYCFQGE